MTPGTLLIVDYPGRRPEGRIGDLSLESHGFQLQEVLTHPLPEATIGHAYAKQLAASLTPLRERLAGVLAYCAGAPIAQEFAQLLVEAGHQPPPLVLFDAAPCTPQDIREYYTESLRRVGSSLREEEIPCELPGRIEDPAGVRDAFRHDLSRRATDVLASEGFRKSEVAAQVDEVVNVYVDYLGYLLAAHHATSPMWGGDVMHVVSSGHGFRSAWPGARSTWTVPVATDRASLMFSEEVRNAAVSFLEPSVEGRLDSGPSDR